MKLRPLFVLFLTLIPAAFANAQAARVMSNTYQLADDGNVSIDTYKGSIRIEGWDKEEVAFEARVEVPEGDPDQAREWVDLVDINVESRLSSFRVETSYDRLENQRKQRSWWDSRDTELPFVHYTLRIPRSASVRIEDYKSGSDISDLTSSLTIETYKGDVRVKDHRGEIRLETYKGEIDVDFADKPYASSFETYKGDIVVGLPRGSAFDVRIDLGRRADLVSDFDVKEHKTRWDDDDDREFRDTVNGGGPTLSFETTKGTIRLNAN